MDTAIYLLLVFLLVGGFLFTAIGVLVKTKRKWGIKGVVILCIAATCIGIPTCKFSSVAGKQAKCMQIEKDLALVCNLYAHDHDGNYPQKLDDLSPDYIPDLMILANPLAPDKSTLGYDYFGAGGKDTDPPDKILIRSHYASNSKRAVVYFDMHGAWIKDGD